MFFKIGVLKIFRNIHRKTPALESLFNKVVGLQEIPTQAFSWEYCEISKTSFFNRIAPFATSVTNPLFLHIQNFMQLRKCIFYCYKFYTAVETFNNLCDQIIFIVNEIGRFGVVR